jgi:hypothetical protein
MRDTASEEVDTISGGATFSRKHMAPHRLPHISGIREQECPPLKKHLSGFTHGWGSFQGDGWARQTDHHGSAEIAGMPPSAGA